MFEVILITISIIVTTIVIVLRNIKKEKCIICSYNCESCKEKDVCGIRED
ncbi:hypothetical protein NRP93_002507 [Clostridium botulinum]|nr:hypothetical protein [Clostridium botulinum]